MPSRNIKNKMALTGNSAKKALNERLETLSLAQLHFSSELTLRHEAPSNYTASNENTPRVGSLSNMLCLRVHSC